MYCKNCGAVVQEGIDYCQQCGSNVNSAQVLYNQPPISNQNNTTNSIINKLKKIRIVSLLSLFAPIIINFIFIVVVLVIFVQGPLNGDIDNLNYVSTTDLGEFAIQYGVLYIFTCIINVATFIVMISNFKKVTKIQESFHQNHNLGLLIENLQTFNNAGVIIITVIDTVLFGFVFAIPQIIFCVIICLTLNEIKRDLKLLSFNPQN